VDISPLIIYFRNTFLYDPMKILGRTSPKGEYVNLRMVENPDGTFRVFSYKRDYKTDKKYLSMIALDSKLKQISEKLIPVYIDSWQSAAVSFDGVLYRLISHKFNDDSQKIKITTLTKEGKLVSDLEAKRAYEVDFNKNGYNIIQYLVDGDKVYIFYDDARAKRQLLTEVDIKSGEFIREFVIPSETNEIRVSQGVIDPRDKSIYFACTDSSNNVSVWKFAQAGQFAQIISQKMEENLRVALCMDDKPYLVTSAYKKGGINATVLTAYAINGNKLDKLWSYQAEGKAMGESNCLKTQDYWYVSNLYLNRKQSKSQSLYNDNPEKDPKLKWEDYFSAVMKFDFAGKLVSQSKYPTLTYPNLFQLLKTKDGRILYTGSVILYKRIQPFVGVVK
jgi:hypothetical protein